MEIGQVTGIILAGGKSRRMGHDKGQMLLKGRPLIAYAIDTLLPVCHPLLISANHAAYNQFGLPVVSDFVKNIGPMGGIRSGLSASGTDISFVLSCDMPLIPTGFVRYLLGETAGFDAVVPVCHDLPEPLCACYRKSVSGDLQESIRLGQYKLQDFLQSINTRYIEIIPGSAFYNEFLFFNINVPGDLERIEAYLEKTGRDE